MIIVRLMGGLGNQMFQYALGRRLALERGVPLKLDLSWFQTQALRRYMLDRFQVNAEIATPEEIACLVGSNRKAISGWLYRIIQNCLPYYRRNRVTETNHSFNPLLLNVKSNVLLIGYWQSEKYFKEIGTHLRQEFSLKRPFSPKSLSLADRIQRENSISLHVRRKDYVESPRRIEVYDVCSIEYYRRAVEYLRQIVPNASFFVFSDDISWATVNLKFLSPAVEMVDVKGAAQDVEELILMSYCKHHIIANSSFSWWGAWLGATAETVTIAPRQWIRDRRRENRDITPVEWIRM